MQTRSLNTSTVIIHLFFSILTIVMVLPMIFVVILSFTSENSLIHNGFRFIPLQWDTLAYRYFFQSPGILLNAYGITILITVIGSFIAIFLTSSLGYVISRRDYGLNRITTFYVFFTMLFSGGVVPFYIMMTQWLHLKDSLLALILPGLLSPFYVMVMKGFVGKIPFELIESAKIDGAREWRIYLTIILPLSTPAIATLGLFISFNYWNEWFNALLFIDNDKLVPLQLLLVRTLNSLDFIASRPEFAHSMASFNNMDFPRLSVKFAMVVLAAGPMMFVFPFFQRYFVKGLTVGALKG